MIILRRKKQSKELRYITVHEVYEDKLFVSPLREEVAETSKEKYRKGEKNDSSIGKYRSRESFFPGEVMQECDKEKPAQRQQCAESPDFESEEFDRRVHEE